MRNQANDWGQTLDKKLLYLVRETWKRKQVVEYFAESGHWSGRGLDKKSLNLEKNLGRKTETSKKDSRRLPL